MTYNQENAHIKIEMFVEIFAADEQLTNEEKEIAESN